MPKFKKRSRLMSEEAADLMAELSAVYDKIDDLRDRFIDRIKCPGVPRGVLMQTEFGKYGSNRSGWLRHIADTADSLVEPVDHDSAIGVDEVPA
jgi:hypothetical protein